MLGFKYDSTRLRERDGFVEMHGKFTLKMRDIMGGKIILETPGKSAASFANGGTQLMSLVSSHFSGRLCISRLQGSCRLRLLLADLTSLTIGKTYISALSVSLLGGSAAARTSAPRSMPEGPDHGTHTSLPSSITLSNLNSGRARSTACEHQNKGFQWPQ